MRLRVNSIDCVAHGLCAELLPEWIRLDESGRPILADAQLPADLVEGARRAANACPTLALMLDPDEGLRVHPGPPSGSLSGREGVYAQLR
jgi:ferredoxin